VDAEGQLRLVILSKLREDLGVLRVRLQVLLSLQFGNSLDSTDECLVRDLLPVLLEVLLP
jgi:hypothetical protein